MLYRLLRGFLGAKWQPVAVCFTHSAPQDPTTHRRVFGTAARFKQDFDGITMYATDTARRCAAKGLGALPGVYDRAYRRTEGPR